MRQYQLMNPDSAGAAEKELLIPKTKLSIFIIFLDAKCKMA